MIMILEISRSLIEKEDDYLIFCESEKIKNPFDRIEFDDLLCEYCFL